jgi:Xaa-Pro aminopeptidase
LAFGSFLYWFAQEAPKGQLTELDAEARLLEFRQQQPGFRMTSFDAIAGWADHGAIVHYHATPETNARIQGNGLFLLDSGGQYPDGTTDVTRTIGVGNPTEEMKRSFTTVMKAHIALARAVFPEGATGAQLDGLTRAPLWEQGLEFSHGTGHGVGVYLCVHEDSVRISPRGHNQAKANMIVSNEPGFYKEGEYGIRCENLILSYDTGKLFSDGRAMLAFETITLAPFDRSLLLDDMLTPAEKAWLNDYHQRVYDTLSPFLNADEKAWLKTFTA